MPRNEHTAIHYLINKSAPALSDEFILLHQHYLQQAGTAEFHGQVSFKINEKTESGKLISVSAGRTGLAWLTPRPTPLASH